MQRHFSYHPSPLVVCSKNLTWRDMQHLVVRTSKPAHLNTNDWATNGVGRKGSWGLRSWGGGKSARLREAGLLAWQPPKVRLSVVLTVSHSYGYGLLDAGAMVGLAQNWTSVGPQRKCVLDILAEPRFVGSWEGRSVLGFSVCSAKGERDTESPAAGS